MRARIIKRVLPERLRLPIIGKIKVGYKDERGIPHSADYFIPSGKYANLFLSALGERPSTIRIVFPSDNAATVCREEWVYRDDGGKLVATGDGETFRVWNGTEYKEFTTEKYPDLMDGLDKKWHSKSGWQVTITLNFVIPEVRGVMGVWQFISKGSASTIPSIRDAFDAMLETNGHCAGVIFDLSVKYAKSQKPNQTSRYPVVTLTANESRENLEKVMEAKKPIMIE